MSVDSLAQPAVLSEAAPPPREHATMRRRTYGLGMWGPPLVVLLAVIGFWYLLTYVLLDPETRFLLPAPHRVVQVAFLDGGNLQDLMVSLWRTTQVAAVGLGLAIVIGIVYAVLMSQAQWIERSLFPYAVLLQCIPILALVPLIGFWFGFGFQSRVIVCVLIALFPIINNTLFGLLAADRGLHDLFTLHNKGRLTRLFKLQFPAAMPAIFSGLRIAAGASVIGAVVGDLFFKQGEPGIGILIDLYRARLQAEQMFGAIIVAGLLGVVVFILFGLLARLAVGSWHESSRTGS